MTFNLSLARQFLPFVVKCGTPALLGFLARIVPWKDLREVVDIVDIMDASTTVIYQQKIDALRAGDDAMMQQVGEGKDIMSVLRT